LCFKVQLQSHAQISLQRILVALQALLKVNKANFASSVSSMPVATVKYVDPAPLHDLDGQVQPHWSKVEGPFQSFELLERNVDIKNISGRESDFEIDTVGFAVHHSPVTDAMFADERAIREEYYPVVENLLRSKLDNVHRVVIFDHTLRQMVKESLRKPVMQVHVDQTAEAAELRVRRHMPSAEAECLLKSRYALVNVWRPIGNPALEYPLAMVDWRTLLADDFVRVDLLYPVRDSDHTGDDDRGLEAIPSMQSLRSTEGYEVKGATYGIAPNGRHAFYYVRNMTPDTAIVFKCADSQGPPLPDGLNMTASCCAHTAFVDPETPANAPSRRSIEVRCLVFFKDEVKS
jgi:hypothetical protein